MRLFEMLKGMLSLKTRTSSQNSTTESVGSSITNTEDLSSMRVVELKALAKKRGFSGYSKLNRSQLLDLLN